MDGRTNLVKRILQKCVTCYRVGGKSAAQIIGQLPLPHIQVAAPFTYIGVHYPRFFDSKCTAHRTTHYYEIHAAIFVCMTTRAVHVEVATNLTTEASRPCY